VTSRNLLFISPHFPPDSSAGAHRARVLAPHLSNYGWNPTILTVDSRDYEGSLDGELEAMLPRDLDVVRVRAMAARRTRPFGIGDLGLRAFPALASAARRLMTTRRFAAAYVTTYPIYPAVIGARLKRQFGLPFVLDLQDPWVSEWGRSLGPRPGHGPDLKSRISRKLATVLERRVLPKADAITTVSTPFLDELRVRYPALASRPGLALPIGADPADLRWVRQKARPLPWFAPGNGTTHLVYVGTLLPLGFEILDTVLECLAALRRAEPTLAETLRLHFIGTSNQSTADLRYVVTPRAEALGVADLVTEHPARVPYADALRAQAAADGVLLLGASEARYAASKMSTALLAARPVLAVCHESSDIAAALRDGSASRHTTLVTFDQPSALPATRPALMEALTAFAQRRHAVQGGTDARLGPLLAPALAERFAELLNAVVRAT
jgi:hypothetical protein